MNEEAERIKKVVTMALVVAGLIGFYFFDNIKGYYRFKAMCNKEGGLRVYTPLKKNVGWIVQGDMISFGIATDPAQLNFVSFVRYKDGSNGRYYDVRYVAGNPGDDHSYDKKESNFGKPVIYSWRVVNEYLPGELRLSRSGYEIKEISSDRIAVRYYEFGYSKFNQNKTLLAAPSIEGCFTEPGRWLREINSSAFYN